MSTSKWRASTVPFSGPGVYNAKERLQQLGAFWDKAHKAWDVPIEHKAEAEKAVEEGRLAGVLLDPDPDLPNYERQVRRIRERAAGGYGPATNKLLVPCWECGEKNWPVDENYYCGCVERVAQQGLLAAKRKPTNWDEDDEVPF